MARHPFPLVDTLLGIPTGITVKGGPVLQTHGVILELFADSPCTVPLDATTTDGLTAITTVTIPTFLGPNSETTTVVYGRPVGATGPGIPLYRADALGTTTGGGGSSTITDNGDGTLSSSGTGIVDNGDGTITG